MSTLYFDLPKPDTMVWQAFTLAGRRTIRRCGDVVLDLGATRQGLRELSHETDNWMTLWPVRAWRRSPGVAVENDFLTDTIVVHLHARGLLDLAVRLGDHQTWLMELP